MGYVDYLFKLKNQRPYFRLQECFTNIVVCIMKNVGGPKKIYWIVSDSTELTNKYAVPFMDYLWVEIHSTHPMFLGIVF